MYLKLSETAFCFSQKKDRNLTIQLPWKTRVMIENFNVTMLTLNRKTARTKQLL